MHIIVRRIQGAVIRPMKANNGCDMYPSALLWAYYPLSSLADCVDVGIFIRIRESGLNGAPTRAQ